MYRRSARPKAAGQGDLVSIRTYNDTVEAETDRSFLFAAGITAHVFDGGGFNPILAAAVGAIQLQVAEGDREDALEALGIAAPEESEADDEAEGTIRCPRCELAYCAFERPRMRNAPVGIQFIALIVTMFVSQPRWHCLKCKHVWNDPKEGPAAITRLVPGDPRPIFRLHRTHAVAGFFFGLVASFVAMLVFRRSGSSWVFLAITPAGTLVGRAFGHDVCSNPDCRASLLRGADQCIKCKGSVAGAIDHAEDHYAAAADFRRELAGIRAHALERRTSKKAKKKKAKREKEGAQSRP